MKKIKVAIDLRSLMETGGKISGVENYALHLANGLHGQPEFECFGFYNAYKPAGLPKELNRSLPLKATRIPNKIFNLLLALKLVKFEKLYGDFDLLIMPDLRPFSIFKGTKFVLTVHDLSPVLHPEFYSLRRRLWHKFINYAGSYSRADLILPVSEYTKSDLKRIFKIADRKLRVIYPGIDPEIFKVQTQQEQRYIHKINEKYDLPERYILSISTLEPRKNIPALIAAFAQIEDQDLHLVIAGRPGWLYRDILDACQNSSKKDKIKLLGYVEERDKPLLISRAEMLCYPSLYEGFGFQPLEAMACGVPVITSSRTSMPEICGDAALLVEPAHQEDLAVAINALAKDKNLRAGLIEKGFVRAADFTWSKSINILVPLLQNLCA